MSTTSSPVSPAPTPDLPADLPTAPRRLPSVTAEAADPLDVAVDLLVVPAFKGGIEGPGTGPVLAALGMEAPPVTPSFRGDIGETLVVATPGLAMAGVMFVGLGQMVAIDDERLRRAAQIASRAAGGVERVATTLAHLHPTDAAVQAVAEGFLLSAPRGSLRSTEDDSGIREVVVLVPSSRLERSSAAIGRARVHARAAMVARALVDLPPQHKRPPQLAERISALLQPVGEVEVLDRDALVEGGFGGIVGVGRGSSAPPCLVEVRYRPAEPLGSVVLVGKGITFDSGGLSLKRGTGMDEMKSDMAGAAAIVGAMTALRELDIRLEVTALLPLAENLPDGDAQRPDDVIRIRDATTVEVANTDAEGRLVLADGIALAVERTPDVVIDLATLTGSAVAALGPHTAALFATDEHLATGLLEAARVAGEPLWRLPFDERLEERLASPIADVRNLASSPSEGGAITAALFLRRFAKSVPFAHLDIAGPAFRSSASSDVAAGGTGYGARLLLRWLEQGR